ncbi:MAG TPA: hypothetical protein VK750_06405 [Cytophagaceae bacterium]|jgi:hypothetical protein|nr:hypothetical protein [Cytophagaceae bacterium]
MNTLRLSEVSFQEITVQSNHLTSDQLITQLQNLASSAYHVMLKTRVIANVMKRPFKNAEYYSSSIMDSLNQYVNQLQQLGDLKASVSVIAKPYVLQETTSDWKQPLKELIALHAEIKNQILNIFVLYKEADFPETFKFLRQQLFLHEEQLWDFKSQLEN